MNRGATGKYHLSSIVGDEAVRAFVPSPLPPDPPIVLDGKLQQLLEKATLGLGRLDAVSTLLPDKTLFLYTYVRKEAVLSSQIEGTQSTLSDLLLFELDEAPGVPISDVVEVSNYVAALQHGLTRLSEGFPLSNRLLREIHGVLLSRGRGESKSPGEFRRSQNWIGGSRPGNANFVSAPPELVPECMGALEKYLHAKNDGLPVLVRAALAHVQFETIHPFLDGNGRVGRLLITLQMCHAQVLREPLLYLSLYLKRNRATYYDLLDRVRQKGDWESWLTFFLEGVRVTSESAVATAEKLTRMFADDRAKIARQGRASGSMLRAFDALREHPLLSLREIERRGGITYPTATSAVNRLCDLGIAAEFTGKRRNKMYKYTEYLSVLDEGTEPALRKQLQ